MSVQLRMDNGCDKEYYTWYTIHGSESNPGDEYKTKCGIVAFFIFGNRGDYSAGLLSGSMHIFGGLWFAPSWHHNVK